MLNAERAFLIGGNPLNASNLCSSELEPFETISVLKGMKRENPLHSLCKDSLSRKLLKFASHPDVNGPVLVLTIVCWNPNSGAIFSI